MNTQLKQLEGIKKKNFLTNKPSYWIKFIKDLFYNIIKIENKKSLN